MGQQIESWGECGYCQGKGCAWCNWTGKSSIRSDAEVAALRNQRRDELALQLRTESAEAVVRLQNLVAARWMHLELPEVRHGQAN